MSYLETLPGRASDAGPASLKTAISRQKLYSFLCDMVVENSRDLDHLYRDNRSAEQEDRIAKIDETIATLLKLKEVA